jgi:RNA polymerase sigma-70 factor (sigma-E family)
VPEAGKILPGRATISVVARATDVTSRYPGPGDSALVPAGPAGQAYSADLAAVFRQHHAELVRLALLLVGDQPTAEDVVQDVYARMHARRRRGPGTDGLLAYVRAAVLNGCRSQLRRRAVARRFVRQELLLPERVTEDSAEQEMIRSQERAQVLTALAALPQRRREVLVLRYYLGLSEAEIARVLGISAGTVKSTAARALAALARRLGEDA